MISRCTNPNDAAFCRYGAKGITVDPRWRNFQHFLDDMGERPVGTTLDRKRSDKGYSKENCKWSTTHQQSRNRSSVLQIEFGGRSQPLSVWCEELNIPYGRTYQRIFKLGWPIKDALSTHRMKPHQHSKGSHASSK